MHDALMLIPLVLPRERSPASVVMSASLTAFAAVEVAPEIVLLLMYAVAVTSEVGQSGKRSVSAVDVAAGVFAVAEDEIDGFWTIWYPPRD